MKRILTLLIITLAVICVQSCKKNDPVSINTGKIYLLKTIRQDGKISTVLEYDNKNRLIELTYSSGYDFKYTYDSNDRLVQSKEYFGENDPILHLTENFTYSSNKITVTTISNTSGSVSKVFYDQSNGRITKLYFEVNPTSFEYEYDNKGNIVKVVPKNAGPNNSNEILVYKYDDNKSPFSMIKGLNLNFYLTFSGGHPGYGVVNNILTLENYYENNYKYNADGFPT